MPRQWSIRARSRLLRSAACAAALAACATSPQPSAIVFADDASREVQAGRAVLIDVRLPREMTDRRIAEGAAAWIPFDRNAEDRFVARVAGYSGSQSGPIILVCEIGERSLLARAALVRAGWQQVFSIDQGYRGWSGDNLPLVRLAEDQER